MTESTQTEGGARAMPTPLMSVHTGSCGASRGANPADEQRAHAKGNCGASLDARNGRVYIEHAERGVAMARTYRPRHGIGGRGSEGLGGSRPRAPARQGGPPHDRRRAQPHAARRGRRDASRPRQHSRAARFDEARRAGGGGCTGAGGAGLRNGLARTTHASRLHTA